MRTRTDPFRTSIIGRSAAGRAMAVLILLAALWLAIGWAAALP